MNHKTWLITLPISIYVKDILTSKIRPDSPHFQGLVPTLLIKTRQIKNSILIVTAKMLLAQTRLNNSHQIKWAFIRLLFLMLVVELKEIGMFSQNVVLDFLLPTGPIGAESAGVRLLAGVDHVMALEVMSLADPFGTYGTNQSAFRCNEESKIQLIKRNGIWTWGCAGETAVSLRAATAAAEQGVTSRRISLGLIERGGSVTKMLGLYWHSWIRPPMRRSTGCCSSSVQASF